METVTQQLDRAERARRASVAEVELLKAELASLKATVAAQPYPQPQQTSHPQPLLHPERVPAAKEVVVPSEVGTATPRGHDLLPSQARGAEPAAIPLLSSPSTPSTPASHAGAGAGGSSSPQQPLSTPRRRRRSLVALSHGSQVFSPEVRGRRGSVLTEAMRRHSVCETPGLLALVIEGNMESLEAQMASSRRGVRRLDAPPSPRHGPDGRQLGSRIPSSLLLSATLAACSLPACSRRVLTPPRR
eukprot:COSAG01_NODE_864_length_13055_cov_18.442498_15_plen_245_part_00